MSNRKRFFLIWLVAVVAAAIIGALLPASALADDRLFLTGISFPEVKEMRRSGVWLWCYRQEPQGQDILGPVATALEEWSEVTGVAMFPDCVSGNLQIASGGLAFVYGTGDRPGCGTASTACLPEYGEKETIVYDAATMYLWGFRSQTSVALHEDGHALADLGEQYNHTQGVFCTGKPWTVMDCGLGHAVFIQPFDADNFRLFNFPPSVQGANLVGNILYYARTTDRATRIAIWFEQGGFFWWSGLYGPPCTEDGWVCAAVPVSVPPSTSVWVGAENAISGSWGRNLYYAGTSP